MGAALACLLSVGSLAVAAPYAQADGTGAAQATITPAASRTSVSLTAQWFATVDDTRRASLRERLTHAAETDHAARFGLGAVQFFSTLETFALAMNRHGLEAPRGLFALGVVDPAGANTSRGPVEPITHALFREHLERLHAGLEEAATTLATVDRAATLSIPIDLGQARVRLAENGEGETLLALARRFNLLAPTPRPGQRNVQAPAPVQMTALPFTFDTADAVWLQGYANVVMAQLDFALAHDFERLFEQTFHVLFPRAGLAVGRQLTPPERLSRGPFDANQFLDAVAMLHLMDFAVIDPPRRARTRERLLEVVRLSRENWALIEGETDAEREWLPGPQQGNAHPVPGVAVSQAEVDAWRASLDLFEAILEGEVLLPHPRFDGTFDALAGAPGARTVPGRGVNLRRLLESSEPFDVVLYVTGHGALPFMEEGRVAGGAQWRAARSAFGQRGLLGTAIWFN